MELLKKEQKVCVQIDNYTPDLSSYRFVSLCGTLEKVTDTTEYGSVVKIFSDTGKKELSAKFLAAHGLSPEEGWEAFASNKEMIFMKLVKENSRFGLKSP
jgi:nitroimidazol reductase NimA-like FMN-containing flavoprotein (pyridoxamine 5'-phosphate oxidase superfamily)